MKIHVNSHSVIKARAHWMLLLTIWCFSCKIWISSITDTALQHWGGLCFFSTFIHLYISGSGLYCIFGNQLVCSARLKYSIQSSEHFFFSFLQHLQSHLRALLTVFFLIYLPVACGEKPAWCYFALNADPLTLQHPYSSYIECTHTLQVRYCLSLS